MKWRSDNLYLVRLALDGREHPNDSRRDRKVDYLLGGQWVEIECQIRPFDEHTGAPGRLYDKVGNHFVPDEFVRTFYRGRIPGVPTCKRT